MARPLTSRQAAFCRHYFAGKSATEAARLAGYSEAYANRQARQLLDNPQVKQKLAELQAEADNEAIMSAREVLERFTSIARGEGEIPRSTPAGIFELPPDWADRQRALVELAKYHSLSVEKREVTLKKPPSEMTDAELLEAFSELAGG